ncbi:MAG: hypothetical protein HY560_09225 [Gemmatimonadetes bacterium]|nr:hypothetical protein [Gemmatimonadota bacterium]
MLISFSGLDGAGKSTLIAWLREDLERRHHPVTVLHMNDHVGVYAYLRLARDRMLTVVANGDSRHGPRRPGSQRLRGLRRAARRIRDAVVWSPALRRLIYPVDLLIFLSYRLYLEKVRRRVLIMDRYFYDRLVDVANGRGGVLLRLFQRLTPTPDVAILLDVGPDESHARKGEYPVEYLSRRWRVYCAIFPQGDSALVVRNDDAALARQTIAKAVAERMAR